MNSAWRIRSHTANNVGTVKLPATVTTCPLVFVTNAGRALIARNIVLHVDLDVMASSMKCVGSVKTAVVETCRI